MSSVQCQVYRPRRADDGPFLQGSFTRLRIRIRIHIRIRIRICVRIRIRIRTHIRTHIRTRTRIRIHDHIRIRTPDRMRNHKTLAKHMQSETLRDHWHRGSKATIQQRKHPQNTHETLTRARDHHRKTLTES